MVAVTSSVTWFNVESQLSELEKADLELLAVCETFPLRSDAAHDLRFASIRAAALRYAAELLDSNVVNDTTKSPEFDRLLAAAYQSSAQHLEADKGRFESEGETDGYETAVTMLEEYRDGAVRRGNRMVRS